MRGYINQVIASVNYKWSQEAWAYGILIKVHHSARLLASQSKLREKTFACNVSYSELKIRWIFKDKMFCLIHIFRNRKPKSWPLINYSYIWNFYSHCQFEISYISRLKKYFYDKYDFYKKIFGVGQLKKFAFYVQK